VDNEIQYVTTPGVDMCANPLEPRPMPQGTCLNFCCADDDDPVKISSTRWLHGRSWKTPLKNVKKN
jgi:hypothetical protein